MSDRTCIDCKFWNFDGGSPGYSELTPGTNMSSYCQKGHWDADYDDSTVSYRQKLLTGRNCQDFDQANYPSTSASKQEPT